ncbi:hypothetical protein ACFPYJ_00210 [Paenibacillus solisilvae]|uniref:YhfM-like domain-containing protein n=1 Tax=Paenibacillus solisilvae TaxID=2486751 RepID=A0ABW0VP99_9BACL
MLHFLIKDRRLLSASLFLMLCFILLLTAGCSSSNNRSYETWGSKHDSNSEKVQAMWIKDNSNNSSKVYASNQAQEALSAFEGGLYQMGQLDIKPSDYTITMKQDGGDVTFSLWIKGTGGMFTDSSDDSGYYQFTTEGEDSVREIMEQAGFPISRQ